MESRLTVIIPSALWRYYSMLFKHLFCCWNSGPSFIVIVLLLNSFFSLIAQTIFSLFWCSTVSLPRFIYSLQALVCFFNLRITISIIYTGKLLAKIFLNIASSSFSLLSPSRIPISVVWDLIILPSLSITFTTILDANFGFTLKIHPESGYFSILLLLHPGPNHHQFSLMFLQLPSHWSLYFPIFPLQLILRTVARIVLVEILFRSCNAYSKPSSGFPFHSK